MIDLNNYIGKSYELGARGPQYFDCWGLVMSVYRDLNIALPDWTVDSTDPLTVARAMKDGIDQSLMKAYATLIDVPRNFDIAFLLRGERAHHCGIFYNGAILHINDDALGVVHERADRFIKTGRGFLSYYRWLGG